MIGQAVYNYLRSNADLTNLIGDSIYPHYVPYDFELNGIVYSITSIEAIKNKTDEKFQDRYTIQLIIITKKYNDLSDIGIQLRKTLKQKNYKYNNKILHIGIDEKILKYWFSYKFITIIYFFISLQSNILHHQVCLESISFVLIYHLISYTIKRRLSRKFL